MSNVVDSDLKDKQESKSAIGKKASHLNMRRLELFCHFSSQVMMISSGSSARSGSGKRGALSSYGSSSHSSASPS